MLHGFLLLFLALDVSAATIGGRVTGELRGAPVAGMEMIVWSESGAPVRTTTTNADGRYAFDVPAGRYYVSTHDFFGASGYVDQLWQDIECDRPACDPRRGTLITVSDFDVRDRIDFVLRTRGSVLTGRIVDARTGAPIAGARVDAIRLSTEQTTSATTDADGRYAVQPLAEGDYAVKVTATGYAVTLYQTGVCPEPCRVTAAPLRIANGSVATADVALDPLALLTGTVVDAVTGAPIPSALLQAGRGSSDWMTIATITGGRFSTYLYPGTYLLRVTAAGYQPLLFPDLPCVSCGPAAAAAITVGIGDRREIALHIHPLGRITGRVLSETGAPLRNARMTFAGESVTTGADGRFAYTPSAQPRNGEIVLSHPEFVPVSRGRQLVAPGTIIDLGDIVLQPRGAFVGRVMGPTGPVTSARVSAIGNGETFTVETASDGSFRSGRVLLDADYTFVAEVRNLSAFPWAPEIYDSVGCSGLACTQPAARGTPVRGRPGGMIGPIEFQLASWGNLRVTRRNRDTGEIIRPPGAFDTILIADRYGNLFSAPAGGEYDGRTSVYHMTEGTYYLPAEPIGPGLYRERRCNPCDVIARGARIDIVPGQTVEITIEVPRTTFLLSIDPQAGPTEGGNTITLRGSGFNAATTVTVGGVPAIIRSVTANTLVAEAPRRMAEEVVDVVVTQADGSTDAIAYRYTNSCTPIVAAREQEVMLAGNGEVRVAASASGPITYEWFLAPLGSTRYPLGTGEQVNVPAVTARSLVWARLTNPCSTVAINVTVVPVRGHAAGGR